MHLLAVFGLITNLYDRFSYSFTSTSEIYTLSYTWILKNVTRLGGTSPYRPLNGCTTPGILLPPILKSTSWVKLSWWKFIKTFVRLFQSRARNQALATSTKMFRVSTVWVAQPVIRLNQAFFSVCSDISIAGREGPPDRKLLLVAPHISLT